LTNGSALVRIVRVSHPDPHGPPDLTPIRVGEVWENPVTRERATILELPYQNPESRATAELTALVGARVVGEHRHPAIVERFTALEGELTLKLDGQTSILREGESAVIGGGRVARLVECQRPRRAGSC
jgi:quercetin dioxygenase-like cupin family protein